jgi:hypothetical protein
MASVLTAARNAFGGKTANQSDTRRDPHIKTGLQLQTYRDEILAKVIRALERSEIYDNTIELHNDVLKADSNFTNADRFTIDPTKDHRFAQQDKKNLRIFTTLDLRILFRSLVDEINHRPPELLGLLDAEDKIVINEILSGTKVHEPEDLLEKAHQLSELLEILISGKKREKAAEKEEKLPGQELPPSLQRVEEALRTDSNSAIKVTEKIEKALEELATSGEFSTGGYKKKRILAVKFESEKVETGMSRMRTFFNYWLEQVYQQNALKVATQRLQLPGNETRFPTTTSDTFSVETETINVRDQDAYATFKILVEFLKEHVGSKESENLFANEQATESGDTNLLTKKSAPEVVQTIQQNKLLIRGEAERLRFILIPQFFQLQGFKDFNLDQIRANLPGEFELIEREFYAEFEYVLRSSLEDLSLLSDKKNTNSIYSFRYKLLRRLYARLATNAKFVQATQLIKQQYLIKFPAEKVELDKRAQQADDYLQEYAKTLTELDSLHVTLKDVDKSISSLTRGDILELLKHLNVTIPEAQNNLLKGIELAITLGYTPDQISSMSFPEFALLFDVDLRNFEGQNFIILKEVVGELAHNRAQILAFSLRNPIISRHSTALKFLSSTDRAVILQKKQEIAGLKVPEGVDELDKYKAYLIAYSSNESDITRLLEENHPLAELIAQVYQQIKATRIEAHTKNLLDDYLALSPKERKEFLFIRNLPPPDKDEDLEDEDSEEFEKHRQKVVDKFKRELAAEFAKQYSGKEDELLGVVLVGENGQILRDTDKVVFPTSGNLVADTTPTPGVTPKPITSQSIPPSGPPGPPTPPSSGKKGGGLSSTVLDQAEKIPVIGSLLGMIPRELRESILGLMIGANPIFATISFLMSAVPLAIGAAVGGILTIIGLSSASKTNAASASSFGKFGAGKNGLSPTATKAASQGLTPTSAATAAQQRAALQKTLEFGKSVARGLLGPYVPYVATTFSLVGVVLLNNQATANALLPPLPEAVLEGETSQYLTISKTADPVSLQNGEKKTISYTIKIEPKGGYTISIVNIEDKLTGVGAALPPRLVSPPIDKNTIAAAPFSDPVSFSYQITDVGGDDMKDMFLQNTLKVDFTASKDGEAPKTDSLRASASVKIGNPKLGCFVANNTTNLPDGRNVSSTLGINQKSWSPEELQLFEQFGTKFGRYFQSNSNEKMNICNKLGEINVYRASGMKWGGWNPSALGGKVVIIYDNGIVWGYPAFEYTLIHELGHSIDYNTDLGGPITASFPNHGCIPTYPSPSTCGGENVPEAIALYAVGHTYHFSRMGNSLYPFEQNYSATYKVIKETIFDNTEF